jgi:hypothetical protein
MKLAEALEYLLESCPHLFPLKAGEGLAEVEHMLKFHRKDVKAMEIVAHSYRARERWGKRNMSPPDEMIRVMELGELRKLAGHPHGADTRKAINAEILKRVAKAAAEAAALMPLPPLPKVTPDLAQRHQAEQDEITRLWEEEVDRITREGKDE